jgi:hypothetical protein
MALVRVAGLKRRERLLLLALVVFCILSFSPMSPTFSLRRVLPYTLFPFSAYSADGVLKYVNPLIGTVNGGKDPRRMSVTAWCITRELSDGLV